MMAKRVSKYHIPQSVKTEHEELHAELNKAIQEGGKVGDAANAVARLLHQHYAKEEESALPLLGMLPHLAEGEVAPDMGNVLSKANKLRKDLAQMLDEHKTIVAALKKLSDAASKEDKMQYIHFAQKLMLHIQHEEEILYPAAILAGEYIRLKLNK